MKYTYLASLIAAAGFVVPSAAFATSHEAHAAAPAGAVSAAPLSSGEVRKLDLDAKKITIRHGPLENLGMPPMTMVFRVSDPALLTQVKTGDKIRFQAEKRDGAFMVTRIERE